MEEIIIYADIATGGTAIGLSGSHSVEVEVYEDGRCISSNQWLQSSPISRIVSWKYQKNYWGLSKTDFSESMSIQTDTVTIGISGKNSLKLAIPFFNRHLAHLEEPDSPNR
jgi:hypothetical protein